MTATVHAYPRKQFFIEMFTRDIALEDCILDLIDNSLDALLRSEKINIEEDIVAQSAGHSAARKKKARIHVEYSPNRVSIIDDCGGIRYEEAVKEVFCFGHTPDSPKGRLGIYGIGMKRAIFKIGNRIAVESSTGNEAFRVDIDVKKWASKDETLDDWTFPITKLDGSAKVAKGTSIIITELNKEVVARLTDGTIESNLSSAVSQSYPFILDRFVEVKINKTKVDARPIPFGHSENVVPGVKKIDQDGVKVTLLATLAPKEKRSQDSAGWYVLCNGRVVVNADKTGLTGWGSTLPAFHSKYIGFVGLALFSSDDPSKLPWTTSKRGLNREALVFQRARVQMAGIAKPVITFLNDMYPSDPAESQVEREIAESVKQRDFLPLLLKEQTTFTRIQPVVVKRTTRVQYDATPAELEKVRKRVRKPRLSASEIGRLTFNHYLSTECAE